ncbi:MAG: hypothetical protein WAK66_00125 [Methylocystis sp.]
MNVETINAALAALMAFVMARSRSLPTHVQPAAFNLANSAAYVNFAPNTFRKMVDDGAMPPPRRYGARLVWLRAELDRALALLPLANGGKTWTGAEDAKPEGPAPLDWD